MQSHGGRPSAATAAAAIAAVSATAAASRRGTSPSWPLPPALLPPLPPSQTQTPLCSWRLLALPLPLPALPLQRLLLLLPLPRPSLQRSTSPTHQQRWSAPSSTNAAWCLKSSIKIWAQPEVWHQMHCIHARKDAIHDRASNLHCFIQTSQTTVQAHVEFLGSICEPSIGANSSTRGAKRGDSDDPTHVNTRRTSADHHHCAHRFARRKALAA
jgi:hypothetical protein